MEVSVLIAVAIGVMLGFMIRAFLGDNSAEVAELRVEADRLRKEAAAPTGPWTMRWHGSEPDRGDSVFCKGERIAYLGDQHHDDVTRLVYAHNVAVRNRSAA
jgi:hypothetical protein